MTEREVGVRGYSAVDVPSLTAALVEMQAHYRVPCPSEEAIRDDLNSLPPGTGILVAVNASELLGFAAHSLIWPGPGLRRGLFLKELYVLSAHRRCGVGRALMAGIARVALEAGCSRIDLTADRDDDGLGVFYAQTGARHLVSKGFHRIDGDRLARLAAS